MKKFDFKCPECGRIEEADTHDAKLYCHHEGKGVPSRWNEDPDLVMLKRVYSNVGITFKGSGFYKTDSGVKGK